MALGDSTLVEMEARKAASAAERAVGPVCGAVVARADERDSRVDTPDSRMDLASVADLMRCCWMVMVNIGG